MWVVHWLIFASTLPRVEDPWPSSVGIGLPFTTAGAGGVVGAVIAIYLRPAQRDYAVMLGGFIGFWLGALFYFVALTNQVVFEP